jgi:Leucine-rich repeat (LRR) protein
MKKGKFVTVKDYTSIIGYKSYQVNLNYLSQTSEWGFLNRYANTRKSGFRYYVTRAGRKIQVNFDDIKKYARCKDEICIDTDPDYTYKVFSLSPTFRSVLETKGPDASLSYALLNLQNFLKDWGKCLDFVTVIFLEQCNLTNFPYQLKTLKNLKHLCLKKNCIDFIDEATCKDFPNLKILDLSWNLFDELPKGIIHLKKLKSFYFDNNMIFKQGLQYSSLLQLTHLERLSIGNGVFYHETIINGDEFKKYMNNLSDSVCKERCLYAIAINRRHYKTLLGKDVGFLIAQQVWKYRTRDWRSGEN